MNATSLSHLESFLYENLPPDTVSKLENVFREKVAISVDEARTLGAQSGLTMKQVWVWFTQRRCYDIMKSSAAVEDVVENAVETPSTNKQPVIETYEESRAEESSNYSSLCERLKKKLSSLDKLPASARIRLLREEVRGITAERIPQLAAELNVTPDFIQRFLVFRRGNMHKQGVVFRKTEDVLLMEEKYAVKDRIDRDEAIALSQKMSGRVSVKQILKWFYNTRLRRSLLENTTEVCRERPANKTESEAPVLKSSTYKTFLFEEFKRSNSMDVTRRNHLATHLGLTSAQVFFFFKSLMQSLNKPIGAVLRVLTSMSHTQLVKLTAEYHKSRFIAGIKRQMLSKQLGVSKLAIVKWFYNARSYELKTGDKFKPNTSVTSMQKKLGLKTEEMTVEEPVSSCPKKTNGLNVKHEQILLAELGQSDELTEPRLLSLSQQLNLRYEVIEEWFNENASRATRARASDSQSTGTTGNFTPSRHRKLPLQKDMLFEEFKRAPSLTNERMGKLARQMDLSKSQVYSWFYEMRRKLAATSDAVMSPEYRNRDLNATQIARLEAEFAKHPYERNEINEQLESELSLSAGQIRSWFELRRLCDIRLSWRRRNSLESVEKSLKKEKSIGDGDNDEWSFKPVITAIESKQFKEVEVSEHEFNELLPVKTEKFPESVSTEDIKEEPCTVDTEISEWNFKSELGECNAAGSDDTEERHSEVENFWHNSSVECENDPLDTTNEERLEQEYEKESFPTNDEICSLADELQISQERVHSWFKSRRAKSIFTVEETGIEIIPEMILQVDLTTENDADNVLIPDEEDV